MNWKMHRQNPMAETITGKFGLQPPNGIITGTGTRPEHRTKARYLQKRPVVWWN